MTLISSSDDSGKYRDAVGRKIWRPIRLKPHAEESKQHQEGATEDSQVFWSSDFPNLVMPAESIDQIDTENNLNALSDPSSFHFSMADGLPIDEQETWIIPALSAPNWSRTSKLEAQDIEVKGYISHIRKLIKSLGIYSLSSLASPLASLVLAPFLTHNLSHADYGALAVLNTAISLLAGLTQLGLSFAFFRSYNYDYESQRDKFGVLSTTIALLSLISISTAIATIIAAPWLATLLFKDSSFLNSVRIVGVVVLLQNLTVPGFAWLRAEGRAVFFSILSITNLLVCILANIILVGVLHMGIPGSLIATGSGFAMVAICTIPIILLRAGFRPRVDIARGLLSFGLPSIFTFLSIWILQLSDRFLLVRLGSLVQTASYAVAYSLGGVLSTIVISPVTLAWPSTMFSIAKGDDAANTFRLVFRWYSIILLFAAFGLSLMSTIVLKLFFPPAYQSAAPIIPIIATSLMFYGVYIIFMTGTSIRRKTWYAVAFTTTAALANVGLNIILIPLYGSMGAAVSTLVAYILLALIGYVVNQRIYPVPYEIGIFAIGLLIGIVLYTGSGFLARNEGRYEVWGIYTGALALYGGSLAFLGKLSTPSQKNKS
jgi:O-antigen/teichoic acid export membrane protein